MDSEVVNPLMAVALNVLVWGLGYIYLGKVWKGTYTFFLFAVVWGFYLIYIIIAGFSFSLLLEILAGYFLSSVWFGYDAYNMAIKMRERY
jgi:hypothetical protein